MWFTTQYLPSTKPSYATLSVGLAKLGETETQDLLQMSITFRNKSDRPILIIGSMYKITAISMVQRSLSDAQFTDMLSPAFVNGDEAKSRYVDFGRGTVFQAAPFLAPNTVTDPGQEFSSTFIAYAPRSVYTHFQLRADLFIAADDGRSIHLLGDRTRTAGTRSLQTPMSFRSHSVGGTRPHASPAGRDVRSAASEPASPVVPAP